LFELYGRDGDITQTMMKTFSNTGLFEVGQSQLEQALSLFSAQRFSDDETLAVMKQVLSENKELLDPHSAIGVAAGRAKRTNNKTPLISLATAHPAKFPNAVKQACGQHPVLPASLSDLFERDEHFTVLQNDRYQVQEFIKNHSLDGAN
jgi:threonine synthase